ncbi:MAG: hypothetical protein HOH74_04775, partial [Gemmatimonadetes bacterium]|nr:hypothetical protein [Gemmatimonadota bacterium]
MSEERSLSEELRTAREGRGETLEQVHQRTGIALTILRELEEGEYNVVEPVYARLAINHYATYLGLDGADLEARLRNEVAATRPPAVEMRTSQQPPGQALAPVSPLAELIRSQPPSRLVTIGVIIVVGLAITLYLFGSETADPRASGLRPLPAPRPVATAPAPPVQQQRATAADNTERSATSSEVSSAPAPASATNPPVVAQVTQDPLATVPLSAPDGNISPGTAPETESDATEHVAVVPPVDPQTRPGVADPAVAISPAESGTTPGVPGTTPASTSAVVDSTLVEIAPIAVAGSTSADPDSASGDVAPVAITPPVDDPPDTSRGTPQVALVADTLVAA